MASAGHMQVCTSLQTDKHASTPPLSFFTGRMPFLPPNQQRQSTEGSVIGTVHIICRGVSQHKCKSAAVGFAHVGAAGGIIDQLLQQRWANAGIGTLSAYSLCSCLLQVTYTEGECKVPELPELQMISDFSPIKTCLMTKWPTIELSWFNDVVPSLN